MIARALGSLAPLPQQPFSPLPLGAVRPSGWLREQLIVQARGLSGHLFEQWPDDVGANCAWLGGTGDGWERAPYYLDGLIPLARLLGSKRLIALADRYVEAILASQREDGSFGTPDDDWWPRTIVYKALLQQFGATGDRRVVHFLLRAMAHQFRALEHTPLRKWAIPRAGEGALCAMQLYGLTGKTVLLDLAKRLLEQGSDWTSFFHSFPYGRDLKKTLPWSELAQLRDNPATPDAAKYAFDSYHMSHVVNLAMALKYPAVSHALRGGLKESQAARLGYERLMKGHGVAHGLFTGDEHLSGNMPTQGTETCAVVEAMFSFQTLLALSGDAFWGDLNEKLAYGALPAAFTADMFGHQYDQQVNQVLVSRAKRAWYNNDETANLFGFAPHFGCCTANYHQGWPKFAASLWMQSADGGLAAQGYAPCTVRWRVNGKPVALEVSGGYPYQGDVRIEIKEADGNFPLHLRIPGWADGAHCLINGATVGTPQAGEYQVIERAWKTGDVIELRLPMVPRVTTWSRQTAAVERGPMLYALKVGEEWTRIAVRDGCPECPDWGVAPTTPWNYALLPEAPIVEKEGSVQPAAFGYGKPPVLVAKAVPLPDWKMKNNSAAPPPVLPKVNPEQAVDVELVPYGGTAMRIAQFPVGRVE
jgi:hypothetical protein